MFSCVFHFLLFLSCPQEEHQAVKPIWHSGRTVELQCHVVQCGPKTLFPISSQKKWLQSSGYISWCLQCHNLQDSTRLDIKFWSTGSDYICEVCKSHMMKWFHSHLRQQSTKSIAPLHQLYGPHNTEDHFRPGKSNGFLLRAPLSIFNRKRQSLPLMLNLNFFTISKLLLSVFVSVGVPRQLYQPRPRHTCYSSAQHRAQCKDLDLLSACQQVIQSSQSV